MGIFNNKKTDFDISSQDSVSSTTLFAIKEAYKTVRANLLLNLEEKDCHVISVTSSISGEGKSTSSINLAIAIAQFDKKVLMIDGDLRKKRATKYLNFSNTRGLTDVINGEVDIKDAINVTKYPNFEFLSSGHSVNNPAEMLASNSMNTLMAELKSRYDFIIIDTPPVNVVSDALPVIKSSDGVILVLREFVVSVKDLNKLIDNMNMIKANILGIIYIGTDSTQPYYHSGYNRSYYKKYSHYDGYNIQE